MTGGGLPIVIEGTREDWVGGVGGVRTLDRARPHPGTERRLLVRGPSSTPPATRSGSGSPRRPSAGCQRRRRPRGRTARLCPDPGDPRVRRSSKAFQPVPNHRHRHPASSRTHNRVRAWGADGAAAPGGYGAVAALEVERRAGVAAADGRPAPKHPPGVLRGARPARRLARRPAARGCNPRRLPRRAPRPGVERRASASTAVARFPAGLVGEPVGRHTRTATTTTERICADALVDAERRVEARIAERVAPGLRRGPRASARRDGRRPA